MTTKDEYVYLTNSGKVFTLTGTQLDRNTGKPLRGGNRIIVPKSAGGKPHVDKPQYCNNVQKPVANTPKQCGSIPKLAGKVKKGENKFINRSTITKVKNSDKYQMIGYMECIYPKLGVDCFNRITIICDSREEAQRMSKVYKEFFQAQINNFVGVE